MYKYEVRFKYNTDKKGGCASKTATITLNEDYYINSNDNKKSMITNFIEHPQFDKGSSYISFYISKTTANMLLNNVNGYSNVHRTIVFNNSSHLPLTIYLFLNRKFGKMNGGTVRVNHFQNT